MIFFSRLLRLTVPALALQVGALVAQVPTNASTPEQPFFEWTELRFASDVYAGRRDRLKPLLWDNGGGVFLAPSAEGTSHGETFRQLDDFLYFTGLELPHSVLAIDADAGRTLLFVPSRDPRFENGTRPNDFPGRRLASDPELVRRSGIAEIRPYDELAGVVRAWVRQGRLIWMNLGRDVDVEEIESDFVTDLDPVHAMLAHLQRQHATVRIGNAYSAIARLRMIKGPEEVEAIRRACAVTIGGIRATAPHVVDGTDERTLAGILEGAFKRAGAHGPAFASIIKSGPNSLWPWRILAAHYDRRNRPIRDGELVIFDVGAERDYYVCDVGRTFPVSGRFSASQREKLTMVTAVADEIIAAIRPGVTFAQLREVAYHHIPPEEQPRMQTGSFFGHHIGLSPGDPSILRTPLQPGMIFTVEPWYYNHDAGIAVFVEDVVLVTEQGAENLTGRLPRRALELEALMVTAR